MFSLHKRVPMILLITLAHGHFSLQKSADILNNELIEATNEINYRLPTDVLPLHYIIDLVINLDEQVFSFEGKSSINIIVSMGIKNTITLHAKYLTFDEEYTNLVDVNNQTVKPVSHSFNKVTDFLTVHFESAITVGKYWLNLKYSGFINVGSKGFIRKPYVNENGKKIWLIATHFQATYAREAFPCFDEPAMKATFEISIQHPDNYTAISNMPAISETKDNVDSHKIWTQFDVTPIMSTYLIAFVVSDFKSLSSEDGKFRCWSQKNLIQSCRYALDVGVKELKALEDYMGSRHVIPKIDNVGIPSFSNSAMENWGLVTYTENRLLYHEGITSTADKQRIALTLSHEFAHQWFGNVVSPAWWDQIWLSEGFATYLQYFITDKVEPNWRLMDQVVVEDLHKLALIPSNHKLERPIHSKVNTPSEIAEIFDTITYNIAGSVIRMTSHVLTDKVFQSALRKYIEEKKYGVATSADLVNALDSVAKNFPNNTSLREIFNLWMNQTGYPVIHVNRLSASSGHVLINQTRFTDLRRTNVTNTDLWWIPVNYATECNPNFNDTQPSHWLPPSRLEQEVSFELIDNQWFIINKQQTGFYRVNYDKQNWKLIADYLNTPNYTNIHVINRAQLLDDSFSLKEKGYIDDYTVFLNISRYLAHEDDLIPWYPAFHAFEILNNLLKKTETYSLFKLYILKLIENLENKVGYSEVPEDDHLTKLNRVKVIEWACSMGSVKCSNAATKSLIEYVNGTKKLSSDLRRPILCAGIRTANVTIWNKLFDLYHESKDEKNCECILNALGCSLDPEIIKSFLATVIDANFKIENDRIRLYLFQHLQAVTRGSEAGLDIMLNFILENIEALKNTRPLWYRPYLFTIVEHTMTSEQDEKVKTIINAISNDKTHYVHDVFKYEVIDENTLPWSKKYETQIRSFLLSQKLVDE